MNGRCPNCYSKRYMMNGDVAVCSCGWSGKELVPVTFDRRLIEWGRVTSNGHIYLRDDVVLPDSKILVGLLNRPEGNEIPLNDSVAIGRTSMREDGLYVNITVYDSTAEPDTPVYENAVLFLTLLKQGWHLVPNGYGRVAEDGVTIKNYHVYSFYIRQEPVYL